MVFLLGMLMVMSLDMPVPEPDILGPYTCAGNFATNILGELDGRPEAWGRAGVVENRMEFHAPNGYRVRVLRIYGDFLAWPKDVAVAGGYAGVLWGLRTTAPEGSHRVSPAADNTMLYLQTATLGAVARIAVDNRVAAAGLLEADGVLISKMAVWLNTTGSAIHMEPSFVIEYRFEKEKKEKQ